MTTLKAAAEIKYDEQFEVTAAQYQYLMWNYAQVVCGREETRIFGKEMKTVYWIKVWDLKYREDIFQYLQK